MYFFHDTAYPGRTQAIIARLTLTAVSLLHKGPLHTVQGKQYEQPFSTEPLSLSLPPHSKSRQLSTRSIQFLHRNSKENRSRRFSTLALSRRRENDRLFLEIMRENCIKS